jgi:hypothetical protein
MNRERLFARLAVFVVVLLVAWHFGWLHHTTVAISK